MIKNQMLTSLLLVLSVYPVLFKPTDESLAVSQGVRCGVSLAVPEVQCRVPFCVHTAGEGEDWCW